MISVSTIFYTALGLFICVSSCQSLSVNHPTMSSVAIPSSVSTTAINFQSDIPMGETPTIEKSLPVRKKTIPKPSKRIKIFVEDITSVNELKWFLEEDERPVVIKFYAKWCKKCQRLGKKFDRLAMDLGDKIIDQQFVDGDIRFAAVEYNEESHNFITEDLQIRGFPTVQMYVGTRKLLEAGSSIKHVRKELSVIEDISHGDLMERAEEADDGVLTGLMEESFFDSPDFLNEEW